MSEEDQVIEKIGKVTNKSASKAADPNQFGGAERVMPNKEKFDASLRTDFVAKPETTQQPASLIDEIRALNRRVDGASKVDPQQLAGKSTEIIAQIEDLKNRLSNSKSEIKESYSRVLKSKLVHIDDNLKAVLDKVGLEYIPPEAIPKAGDTPGERFLSMMTQSQDQLKMLGSELEKMGANNATLSPANLLAVQVKINGMQQQIEFFTSVLNKALESTKTIMNVQV